jgi:hypothetical protein
MIAQRFRPVGWVAGIAAAACILYLISLQVATQRGRLEEIDRKIAMTKRDIRQLQTELGTRASLRQLERWNSDVLALSAPEVNQYIRNEEALATLDRSGIGETPSAPPPVMMAVMTQQPREAAPAPSLLARLTAPTAAPKPLTETDKAVQRAIAPRQTAHAVASKLQKVALLDQSLLDHATVSSLSRAAVSEAKRGDRPHP